MLLIDAHKAQRRALSHMASFIFSGEGLTPAIKDTDNPSEFSRGYVEGAKSLERIVFQKDNLVDAAPVKLGRWARSGPFLECSNCGDEYSQLGGNAGKSWNYCPSCGAKMDGYITMTDTEDEDDE